MDHDGQRCARHPQPDPEPDECVRDSAAHAHLGATHRTAPLPVDPLQPRLGSLFDDVPPDDLLDQLAALVPREMRRALMAAFGNTRLPGRGMLQVDDLPRGTASKGRIGFVQ